MASNDNPRPIGNKPATEASAPDETQTYGSNADLRVADDKHLRDAAMSATGADIDNDHADERPHDRSDDSEAVRQQHRAEHEFPDDAQQGDTAQQDDETQQGGGQHTPSE